MKASSSSLYQGCLLFLHMGMMLWMGGRVCAAPYPIAVSRVGAWAGIGDARAVAISGNYAYVAFSSSFGTFAILDISNPAKPTIVSSIQSSGYALDVKVVGNLAYVADHFAGLSIFDVSNPAIPMLAGRIATFGLARRVHVVGKRAYVSSDRLQIIDVSNPASPVILGRVESLDTPLGVHTVGNIAYVASGSAGLQLVDVSNPARPNHFSGIKTGFFNAFEIQVMEPLVYVVDQRDGLQIIDMNKPGGCGRVGGFDTDGQALGIHVVENLAYVADGDKGLQIIDVSNSVNPVHAGGFDTDGFARAVQVVGNLAYVADNEAGLLILAVGVDALQPVALSIQHASGSLTLSWPSSTAGYTLQSASNLSAPTWAMVGETIEQTGNEFRATVAISDEAQFFRLWKP